ncbi:Glycosyltransferase [Quillaja saponaria]|uniref:Glycosyltransferase n=1 Tax=Quillaja saponaria TaxID=32244 RepID=A0AAD7PZR2_QUISA|nr:Glycosyltransferase [Quillaja saponaria]
MANCHKHHHENYDHNHQKQAPVIVIMVPLPAQSHLNQLLQFSCLICSNIPVHYVGSTFHNYQVKHRAQCLNPHDIAKIQFHDLAIPTFPSPENPDDTIKLPAYIQQPFEAALHLKKTVAPLLLRLSSEAKRLIIIHDSLVASVVQDAASIPNAETYAFQTMSTFTLFITLCESLGKPFQIESGIPSKLPSLVGCFSFEIMNFMAYQYEFTKNKSGNIYNTCRLIEGTYIDLLTEHVNGDKKQWAIGPLNTMTISKAIYPNSQHKCLEWLNKQPPNSVLYISFGTLTSMSDQQIKELAIGLEHRKLRFLWVLREADKVDGFGEEHRTTGLPEGFEERMKGIGMVLRDWAPQLEILGHSSTGGFMSHCGWSSCIESISMGVPLVAWPMHWDQPWNAVLVTELLHVGLVINEWTSREKLVTSPIITNAVMRLMASTEGAKIRKRAEELGHAVRQSATDGVTSHMELEAFIAYISR